MKLDVTHLQLAVDFTLDPLAAYCIDSRLILHQLDDLVTGADRGCHIAKDHANEGEVENEHNHVKHEG